MAEGWAAAVANALLDEKLAAFPWIKKHTGAPGAAGTSNAAGDTTRKQASWTSASGGAASNSAQLLWTAVSTAEDYTHFTAWSAETNGTFGFSGTITANAVGVGDNFQINTGDLDVSVPIAS